MYLTRTIKAAIVGVPLRIGKIRGRAGQGVGPDGLPVHQIRADFHHNRLIRATRKREAEGASLHPRATAVTADLRRRIQHNVGKPP